ncbi:phosphomannomutase/phosphoglucomutase [Marinobacter sp. DUT-1]|uniref:phosphomannomutase/phosphoglucomutase n=1 Tax=Marinobacter sp. DUT-1 TaxID=3412037 RepID=UPI003D16A1F7
MKFGWKKTSEDASDDKPAKTWKARKGRGKASGPRLKRLTSIAVSQALVVVLAGIVSVVLLHFMVVQPSGNKRLQVQQNHEVAAAAERLNSYLELLQQSVEGLATQAYVQRAIQSGESVAAEEQLAGALPGIRAVYLFPSGAIPRSTDDDALLGFAGLELARTAEAGDKLYPDAFPRENRWFVQIATPVRNPETEAVTGSLLMVFEASQLQPLLTVVNPELGGQLALVQTVSDTARTVVSKGNGNGDPVSRTLVNPDWSVSYRPARVPVPPVDMVVIALMVGVPVLFAAIAVWLLLGSAQRSLRQDVAALVQWAQKVFGGERSRPPGFRWDMIASAGEVLYRLAQTVDKRISRATNTAPASPGGSPVKAGAEDEPLFQEKGVLDIDMMDGDEDVLGFSGETSPSGGEPVLEAAPAAAPAVQLSPEIFRAYDIRGIVGETLSEDVVRVIGQAIGSEAITRGVDALCVGYDGRHSSPGLADALAQGVMAAGCNVIHIGAVPTPVLYFATHELQTGSGVMVTGSHNPANYNGLKIMLGGETLSGEAIQQLYQRVEAGDLVSGQGDQTSQDVRRAYLDRIVGDIAVAAPLKVVVDAGNGIAGELAPLLIEELGCEVVPLYCEVDGDFPNHHPDPGKPANLEDLIARVRAEGADLGVAFDGDGDRLGVVTNTGKIIWPDRLLMLFARDVVSRNPGADVLYDVKCSRRLANVISEAGGRPIMWKTGHSLMKAKMKETGALLAGEMSGHIFFGERWYGFDDGLYSAARLLEILGIEDRHCDEVFEDFPEDVSTPELNVEVTESSKFAIIERLAAEGDFGDGNISTIDGIRVDYADGWGLCRASNTTPVLVLRFEGETQEAMERIRTVFREQLQRVAPDIVTEF